MNPYYEQGKELLRQITDWYLLTKSFENEQWRMDVLDDLNKISVD
jgi:hypothetical protein